MHDKRKEHNIVNDLVDTLTAMKNKCQGVDYDPICYLVKDYLVPEDVAFEMRDKFGRRHARVHPSVIDKLDQQDAKDPEGWEGYHASLFGIPVYEAKHVVDWLDAQ